MSTPNNNWEVHWRETLAEYEAGPPTTSDWGGMEQLLEAAPVPAATAGPVAPGTIAPWPVWVIGLVSLLALGYWLGSHSADGIGQKEKPPPTEQTSIDVRNPPPASSSQELLLPDTNNNRKALPLTTQNDTRLRTKPGLAINTPTPAGGDKDDAPPAAVEQVEGPSPGLALAPVANEGISQASEELRTAPRLSRGFRFATPARMRPDEERNSGAPPPATKLLQPRQKDSRTLLSTGLPFPTELERWEQRVDELLRSDRLIITPPRRINNGYFPAYRFRN